MRKIPAYKEPLSTILRRPTRGNEEQTAEILRWVAYSSLFTLLVLIITLLLRSLYFEAIVILIGVALVGFYLYKKL